MHSMSSKNAVHILHFIFLLLIKYFEYHRRFFNVFFMDFVWSFQNSFDAVSFIKIQFNYPRML